MRILITGLAGFAGSHFCEQILNRTDHEIVSIERLDSSGYYGRLTSLPFWDKHKHRVTAVFHDLKASLNEYVVHQIGHVDYIFHLAAGTHVDRSITHPMEFILDNVVGTANLLEYARMRYIKGFFYFSTDEVYGPAAPGVFHKETDRHNAANPYAATKSGAEALVTAYGNTYKLPYIITNTMNIFGPRQHPEKFIPMVIAKLLKSEKILIHADQTCTKPGSRFYINAASVADAYLFLLDHWHNEFNKSLNREVFNIVGDREVDNLQLAETIARCVGKSLDYELIDFHGSRPGHDLRYALDGSKMRDLGWTPPKNFDQTIAETVQWYLDNPRWLML